MKDSSNDLMWAISGLTKVIGDSFTSSYNDGKSFCWWSKKYEYFFTLNIGDNGELSAEIYEYNFTHHPKLYAILGYCVYHRIRVNDQWIGWLSKSGESIQ